MISVIHNGKGYQVKIQGKSVQDTLDEFGAIANAIHDRISNELHISDEEITARFVCTLAEWLPKTNAGLVMEAFGKVAGMMSDAVDGTNEQEHEE